MRYRVNTENGYIHGITKGVAAENSNISKEEYEKIKSLLENTPTAPDGFYYRLKDNLEWELCEFPIIEGEKTASEADYQAALKQ